MKIVVLDGYALNPGDLSWDGLKGLGELVVYDRTPADKVVERASGAEIVFTNKTPMGEAVLNQLTSLKFIGVLATGYNVIDIEIAKTNGVVVANVPGYGTSSVVQMVFALLYVDLVLPRRILRKIMETLKGKAQAMTGKTMV
jgi:glycerate dehydrogenase